MNIGVDFDNTIVCYDDVFHMAARELELIPEHVSKNKGHVRDHLRSIGKEADWTELQGIVYGKFIMKAPPFPGVIDFFKACKKVGVKAFIISHKTKHPFLGEKTDLHAAAQCWLEHNGFFDKDKIGLERSHVHFELTKAEKIKRIKENKCDYFIDDLPEFLSEADFPNEVRKILFDPNNIHKDSNRYTRLSSWAEICRELL